MNRNLNSIRCVRFGASLLALAALLGGTSSSAGVFSWTFDGGDLSIAAQSGGQAEMLYFNAATQAETTFGNTGADPSVPDLSDGPGNFVYHGPFSDGGKGGYGVHFTSGFAANGGGAYVNDYTVVMDVYIPTLDWTSLFNTNEAHANDADWYVTPTGAVGIGALGYSVDGVVAAGEWTRLAFVRSASTDLVKYYVDGTEVFSAGAGAVDGRFALYSVANVQPIHFLVHGEGDASGNYSNALYMASFMIADAAYSAGAIAALGGASAAGVPVPEPATAALSIVAAVLLFACRSRWLLRRARRTA